MRVFFKFLNYYLSEYLLNKYFLVLNKYFERCIHFEYVYFIKANLRISEEIQSYL